MRVERDCEFILEVDYGEIPMALGDVDGYQHVVVILVKVYTCCPFEYTCCPALLECGEPLSGSVKASRQAGMDLWGI